jgi:hypothetical protein
MFGLPNLIYFRDKVKPMLDQGVPGSLQIIFYPVAQAFLPVPHLIEGEEEKPTFSA